ncbi:unnamed protein product [Acanthoscelides obtectus]|uniref:Uncharacterized protein n=1 Tax=Acanthoscelides obtectus TaxID=200917 RepID=A0A9P0KZG0_ACAOB|nr:unnamed protein product [Acanthoscelides obtectus]CAK1623447.1 hypothetical protein AOBTE_LOCUS2007 [Acanthoscelides obtectus]
MREVFSSWTSTSRPNIPSNHPR